MDDIFGIPEKIREHNSEEYFEPLLTGAHGLLVERIVSYGHSTPDGTWYDQDKDEWVVILEGEAVLAYEDGTTRALRKGDHVFLPRHLKHRVAYTSSPCIWLAVHGHSLRTGQATSTSVMDNFTA